MDNGTSESQNESEMPPITENMEVEVYTNNTEREHSGWWKAIVKMIKGEFRVVEYQSIANLPSNNSELGSTHAPHSGSYSEIVSSDRIRHKNPNPCLTSCPFFKIELPICDELKESNFNYSWLNQSEAHKYFKRSIDAIVVRYDESKQVLVVIGYAPKDKHLAMLNMKKMAAMLSDMHFRNLKQKMIVIARREEAVKQLESTRGGNYNSSYSSSGYPYSSGQITHYEDEFSVANHLMGLAIGTHGVNIQNARKVENIVSIELDEESGTFKFVSIPIFFSAFNILFLFFSSHSCSFNYNLPFRPERLHISHTHAQIIDKKLDFLAVCIICPPIL